MRRVIVALNANVRVTTRQILKKTACWLAIGFMAFGSVMTIWEPVHAARLAPSPVPPVVYEGVKYVASYKRGCKGFCGDGYVEALDEHSGKKLWDLKVYRVWYQPWLEEDVQWVFINALTLNGRKLVVTNERNERFEIDPKSKVIRKGE
jgi:hypothetical protein